MAISITKQDTGFVVRQRTAIVVAACAIIGACTVTTHSNDEGGTTRITTLGVIQPLSCSGKSKSFATRVYGVGFSAERFVLGYAQDDVICLPLESCSAIFIVEDKAQIGVIRDLFPDLPNACLVGRATLSN